MAGDVRPVILCGGYGRRLYPFSRPHRPKPFLSVNGRQTLVEDAVERLAPFGRPLLVLRTDLADQARRIMGTCCDYCPEQQAQGTAMAMLRAAHHGTVTADTVMIVAPADHVIAPLDRYRAAISDALARVQDYPDRLMLMGVAPRGSSPHVGYIGRDNRGAVTFHEKPDRKTARALVAQGALWNTGHVIAKAGAIISALTRNAPDIVAAHRAMDHSRTYPSFDHCVLQSSQSIDCIAGGFYFKDVGTILNYLGAIITGPPYR